MHLLAAQAGAAQAEGEAIDLGQSPAPVCILSAADSELVMLAAAADRAGSTDLRLANLLRLAHPLSVDLWIEQTARHARLILVRLLGGPAYWPYGVDELTALSRAGLQVAFLPGDASPDPILCDRSTIPPADWHRLHALFTTGGPDNFDALLRASSSLASPSSGAARHRLPDGEKNAAKPTGPIPLPVGERLGEGEAAPTTFPRFGHYHPTTGLTLDKRTALSPPLRGGVGGGGPSVNHPTSPSSGAARHLLPDGEKNAAKPTARIPLPVGERLGEGEAEGASIPILFYRAALEGAGTATIDALIAELETRGLAPLPLVVSSLKEAACIRFVQAAFAARPPAVILNLTGFALGLDGLDAAQNPFAGTDAPVLQLIQSGRPQSQWAADIQGLTAKDLAMQLVLPELDGRIGGLIVGHKADAVWHARTQCPLSSYAPDADGIGRAVTLAENWARLGATPRPERRVAIVLANYPIRDGRLANGVGYDAPQSTVEILRALDGAGYAVTPLPTSPARGEVSAGVLVQDPASDSIGTSPLAGEDGWGGATGNDLMAALQSGPTNADPARGTGMPFPLADYEDLFAQLPQALRAAVTARWGDASADPFCRGNTFHLPALRLGNVVILVQPARGYHLDETAAYHDPDLVPPHGYIAAYLWLRHGFAAHALIHNGKHGNLEWLPGKATALDATSWPAALWGGLPHLYPFIVNDPGEGTQAKRRTGAVIIDHLVPPLTRAETYGPLKDLEAMLDEYYAAAGMDRRRLKDLQRRILDYTRDVRLDRDIGLGSDDTDNLRRIDTFLCDLKEAQIRDGLHIFGQSPTGRLERDLAIALARVPRGEGPGEASLLRALADDLKLGIDPLTADLGVAWNGPSISNVSVGSPSPQGGGDRGGGPSVPHRMPPLPSSPTRGEVPIELLAPASPHTPADTLPLVGRAGEGVSAKAPRTIGQLVDRLETLAVGLLDSLPMAATSPPAPADTLPLVGRAGEGGPSLALRTMGPATAAVLETIATTILPRLRASGPAEIAALLDGLDGKFVRPGPSGAPSRGRLDVLPTGRNFYSVDNRAVPTPTAWELGQKSAENLLLRHFQDHGVPLRALALSVWGTSNMRTGGDDIAQALAFIGARPKWDAGSLRVSGYEIIPLARLGRPRVDVTLRISGFFRDAFPAQIALFDRAIRAIGALDEPEDQNPIAARMRADALGLLADGATEAEAALGAGHRIFGSKPGAYGAGLQGLIDTGNWTGTADLAAAFLDWGQYAYGAQAAGTPERARFAARLSDIEAVVHNQDNREHDLLDSDDYYQFEGGLVATAEHLTGRRPAAWHNDHSRPERPLARTLEQEISRVMRSRVVNPRWLDGVKRHGYKGAFEIIATLDYMFAFAATTGAVKTHHFDLAFEAFVEDAATRDFIQANNRYGWDELLAKFRDAQARGFWTPRSNSAHAWLSGEN